MITYPLIGVIGLHRIGNRIASMHSGKDEFAQEFIRTASHLGVTYCRRAMADSVKEDVAKWLGVSLEYLNANKNQFRLILQGYGTDYMRTVHGQDIWVNRFDDFIQQAQCSLPFEKTPQRFFVVPDIRFHNEVAYIKRQGGVVVRVTRVSGDDYHLAPDTLSHVSETAVADLAFDHEIINKGDLNALRQEAARFANTLIYEYEIGKLNKSFTQGKVVSWDQQPSGTSDQGERQENRPLAERI